MAFTDRTKISEYDATAANNINLGTAASPAARLGEYGVDADAEAMRPSDTNGALRELMAHLKAMDAGTSVLTSPKAGQFLLEAISASITATAVDVFVYDTSKDSDGGSWRKRCQHTSWYNEPLNTATRGSRREFPAVAVIVAEASKVTIYDADDPTLPMWMVFQGSYNFATGTMLPVHLAPATNISSVVAKNAALLVGSKPGILTSCGLVWIDFISDKATFHNQYPSDTGLFKGAITQRNSGAGWSGNQPLPKLVSSTVNDVAVTVLPDAPIDSATGLPVPTIAVATNGGVSVIKDDGTVVDITYTAKSFINSIAFDDDNNITFVNGLLGTSYQYAARKYAIPATDIAEGDGASSSTNDLRLYFPKVGITGGDTLYYQGNSAAVSRVVKEIAIGNSHSANGGLTHLHEDSTTPANGMVAYATSTYNTGWMNGDIKGAFLADTDDTDLVATNTISDRSVNALTLTLADAATVQAVATGAELVSYTFAGAESVTLGSDISTTGALIWWEKVSGIWQLNVNDLSGGTDYVNGIAGTVSTGLTISGTTLSFAASKEMALARATATIPTAAQIAKIYEDEKFLFQDNAACTLYGASDAVTALAHDQATNLLHVGTSAGRSVFQGLRRVDQTSTPVTTAISAVDGLVVEQ